MDLGHANIAATLTRTAERDPEGRAVVVPVRRNASGKVEYAEYTFQQLDRESDRLARGLRVLGVQPGTRLVLMVRPGYRFIALTYALFKAGAVVVLIDPGMGGRSVFRCLDEVAPQGFVAISLVQAILRCKPGRFPEARFNVTVGRRWFWGGATYDDLLGIAWEPAPPADVAPTAAAAIIFTSGSTGPAKGVVYEHGMFSAQVEWLRDFYHIQPGEIDLPAFPLFALFNAAMGVTTVVPDMNPARPARVDPARLVQAILDQRVTQAFGSPAIWNRVGRYCEKLQIQLPTLQRVLSAGAPVPESVLQRMRTALPQPGADIFTPYGATESLPVASISASEVLGETAAQTRLGAGTCVGRPFPEVRVKIVEITPAPLTSLSAARELPPGEIGEIIVRGAVATREYFRRPEATAAAKIPDGDGFWHRMGDVGYFDPQGRLWFCGRKSHIVETAAGRLFTDCCEPIFNVHPRVFRSALVGVGAAPQQRPVLIVEPHHGEFPRGRAARTAFTNELRALGSNNPRTASIETFLFHKSLPVDVRHNVKIAREKLAPWAARKLR